MTAAPPEFAAGARPPPSTGFLDLVRLGAAIAGELLKRPGQFSPEAAVRNWARQTATRLASENLILNLGVKKLLLVGSPELSRALLAEVPATARLSAGSLKRSAMGFLAPRALTISDDDDWCRRRTFNEGVLEPGRTHELAADFVRYTMEAFSRPVSSIADLRGAMGRTMLEVVFGGQAPAQLVDEIERLFGLVQNPIKRALTAPCAARLRERFYHTVRARWAEQRTSGAPSLLRMAYRAAGSLDSTELVEQIPHWMFTFTGSATDLLVRTLALISSQPDIRARVLAEVRAAASRDDTGAFEATPLLEACCIDAAHLYPPVTRTFHHTGGDMVLAGVRIPANMEIMHLFPLFTGGVVRVFDPDRWLRSGTPVASFDPFLGGVRRCPGRTLILLVCNAALASLLSRQQLVLDCPGLRPTLPEEFPSRGFQLRREG